MSILKQKCNTTCYTKGMEKIRHKELLQSFFVKNPRNKLYDNVKGKEEKLINN